MTFLGKILRPKGGCNPSRERGVAVQYLFCTGMVAISSILQFSHCSGCQDNNSLHIYGPAWYFLHTKIHLTWFFFRIRVKCASLYESWDRRLNIYDGRGEGMTTGTALQWYMVAGTTQALPKKPPNLSYTHYNKAGHELFDIVPK